jgi:hypothetical protein
MPEGPDDRGPQHTGEVPPQPNEPAWKKRKPGETKLDQQESENRRLRTNADKKAEEDKR